MRRRGAHFSLLVIVFGILMICSALIEAAEGQSVRSRELDAQFHRAETAFRAGSSLLEAKARIDRVVSALPEDAEALKLRSQILLRMQRPDEALADARRATRLDSDDGEAHLILSEAASAANDTATARTALEMAATRLPRDPQYHVRLSRSAVWVGDLDEAEQLARRALELSPRDASGHYQLASVLIMRDRRSEAVDVLVNGLKNGWIDATFVHRDTILSQVAASNRLSDLLQQ